MAERVRIKVDTDTPPEGSTFTGEWYQWGDQLKKVFVETFTPSELKQQIDHTTGQPRYKRGAGGVTLGTVHTYREYGDPFVREFIVVDDGTGSAKKQFTFREDPAILAAKAKAAKRQEVLNEILDKAVEAGGLDALLAGEEAETFPQDLKFGKWKLSDGSVFQGKKADALMAEAALQEASG